MKIVLDPRTLQNLLHKMDATYRVWSPIALKSRPIEIPQIDIEISLDQLEKLERDPVTGIFRHNGHAVVLYIRDTRMTKQELLDSPEKGPKFHLLDCRTIEDMKRKKQFEKYFIYSRRTGLFKMGYVAPRQKHRIVGTLDDVPIRVCKNCLKKLYPGKSWTELERMAQTFSLEKFLDEQNTHFTDLPSREAETTPPDNYPDNWDQISQAYRRSAGWVCEECGVDLSAPKHHRLLQTHHINGVRGNSSPANLKALCILCHSQSPNHNHMGVNLNDRKLIERLRREQQCAS